MKYVSLCLFFLGMRRNAGDAKVIVRFTSDPKFSSRVVTYSYYEPYKPKVIKNVCDYQVPSSHLQIEEGAH